MLPVERIANPIRSCWRSWPSPPESRDEVCPSTLTATRQPYSVRTNIAKAIINMTNGIPQRANPLGEFLPHVAKGAEVSAVRREDEGPLEAVSRQRDQQVTHYRFQRLSGKT